MVVGVQSQEAAVDPLRFGWPLEFEEERGTLLLASELVNLDPKET